MASNMIAHKSPMLFDLFAHYVHTYVKACCPEEGARLSSVKGIVL